MNWKKIKSWLLTPPEPSATKDDIIAWWEQRRLAFNIYLILFISLLYLANFLFFNFYANGAYLLLVNPLSYFIFVFVIFGLNGMYAKYRLVKRDPKVAPEKFVMYAKGAILPCLMAGFFPYIASYLLLISKIAGSGMVHK